MHIKLEPCAGRASPPPPTICGRAPPTFVDQRAAAADNLSAHRRCHYCCCVAILLQFSMTNKGHQTILRIERNFNPTTSGLFALVPVPSLPVKGKGFAICVLPSIVQTLEVFRHYFFKVCIHFVVALGLVA